MLGIMSEEPDIRYRAQEVRSLNGRLRRGKLDVVIRENGGVLGHGLVKCRAAEKNCLSPKLKKPR